MVGNLRGRVRRRRAPAARTTIAIFLVVGLTGLELGALPASAQVRLRPTMETRTRFRASGKLSPRLSALSSGRSFASPRAEVAALSLPAAGAGSLVREPE